jgi:Ca2+-binding RTX toxin-like protein
MQTKLITGHHTKMVVAPKSDTLYVLHRDADITVNPAQDEPAIGIAGIALGSTEAVTHRNFEIYGDITVNGTNGIGVAIGANDMSGGGKLLIGAKSTISASGTGVLTVADHQRILNQGEISAVTAVKFDGDDVVFRNDGVIFGSQTAVDVPFDGGRIVNTGAISGSDYGISGLLSGTERLSITNSGTISSDGWAISFSNLTGARTTIVNRGTIAGGDYAIIGSPNIAVDTVRNDGTITGRIWLGGGNDVYDGRGGTASEVSGGADDDLYILSDTATSIWELANGGTDTVKSSVNWTLGSDFENLTLIGKDGLTGKGNGSANIIKGNAGSNMLYGLDGSDVLAGGKGDDFLYGGNHADTFVFSKGSGHDAIMDLTNGTDTIDLRGVAGLDSFADIQAVAKQSGSNVVLTFDGGETLTVANFSLVAMTQDDFMF